MLESHDVQARITYAEASRTRLFCYEYDPPPGVPKRAAKYREHRVTIRNGRARTPPLSLEVDGFALARHSTRVANFYDTAEVEARYSREIEAFVAQSTGASRVIVFDHTVRGNDVVRREGTDVHAPVARAHNDYTSDSGPRRVRQLVPDEREAERLLSARFVEINVWRPIRGPLRSWPLAVCSGASMRPRDFLPCDLIYPDRLGEIYEIAHDARHEWYYFPDMHRDEVLLLKCFDSRPDARIGAHTAFEHPHTPADALPRESIETRAFAFFA
jgi:hypothetical protein